MELNLNSVDIPVNVVYAEKRIGVLGSRQLSSIELKDGTKLEVTAAGSGNQKGLIRNAAEGVGMELKDSWGKDATSRELLKKFGFWHDNLYEVLKVANLVIQRCSNKEYSDFGQVYIYIINNR